MTSAQPASRASDEAGERGRWLGVGPRPIRCSGITGGGYCDVLRVNDRGLNLIQPYCTRATLSAYPSSHIVADDIVSRSFARIFEKARIPGRHRVVTSAEAVRDP